MIEGVEKFRAEGQLVALVQLKSARHPRVVKQLSGTNERVAAQIAQPARGNDEVEIAGRHGSARDAAPRHGTSRGIGERVEVACRGRSEACAASRHSDGVKRRRGIAKIRPLVRGFAVAHQVESIDDVFG